MDQVLPFVYPIPQDVHQRINNELNRMRSDMARILTEWGREKKRSVFTGPFRHVYCPNALQGETIDEQCRSAVDMAGFTYLIECLHLGSFEVAERLRQAKVEMLGMLIPKEKFFQCVMKKSEKKKESIIKKEEIEELPPMKNSMDLPVDVIALILEKSPYPSAQNFALTCRTTNNVYRDRSSTMLLPDLAVLLDFSKGTLEVRWWKDNGNKTEHVLDLVDRRKNQILFNTTQLRVETTGGFKKPHLVAVRKFLGGRSRRFKKIVVKADKYTGNVKKMVEMFDLDCVELEVNSLGKEDLEFPKIKTISIQTPLNEVLGDKVFAAKHFTNITCALHNIDTLRKALVDWDFGHREVEKWLILKPFTLFQTPFGRRHRSVEVNNGYLFFHSVLDSTRIPHGEITEYRFHPTK